MVKKGRQRKLLLLGVLSLTLLGLTTFSRIQYGSGLGNDSYLLESRDASQVKSVQGASSKDENEFCPENKPIIGWIDYSGNKTIRYSLPEGEFASSCFESIEEAELAGYLSN